MTADEAAVVSGPRMMFWVVAKFFAETVGWRKQFGSKDNKLYV